MFGHLVGIDWGCGIIIITGMPPHMIAVGMPMAVMLLIMSQRSRIMSIIDALAGLIFIIMPSGIISQDTWQLIIGTMPIMPGIPIMGIMPGIPIMGIMPGIPIMGIPPIMFAIPLIVLIGIPIVFAIITVILVMR